MPSFMTFWSQMPELDRGGGDHNFKVELLGQA